MDLSVSKKTICLHFVQSLQVSAEITLSEDLRKLSISRSRMKRCRRETRSNCPCKAGQTQTAPESKMHPQGFCSCWMLHNYENDSQLWRAETHPLLQGIILTKSGSKYPYSQPFNLPRWEVCSENLTCKIL